VKVALAVLPNGTTGWVPRGALDIFQVVRTHLVIDRDALTATLYRNGRATFHARIGVGRPSAPTPAGAFYVREVLRNFGNPFYGPVAFGTNARSAVLTDWPGGGFIGIHGTNEPQLLPGRVSHGCIRMQNADILRLARLMSLGTPVTIR
jgi:lipoprotein-anchoring transpeptidase ErfK/SrfK